MKMIGPKGMNALAVNSPNGKQVEIKPGLDGLFDISDSKLVKKLKEEGLSVAGNAGTYDNFNQIGYPCITCGFQSLFKKCSRCGVSNE